jgi:hypothetical protein
MWRARKDHKTAFGKLVPENSSIGVLTSEDDLSLSTASMERALWRSASIPIKPAMGTNSSFFPLEVGEEEGVMAGDSLDSLDSVVSSIMTPGYAAPAAEVVSPTSAEVLHLATTHASLAIATVAAAAQQSVRNIRAALPIYLAKSFRLTKEAVQRAAEQNKADQVNLI